MYLSTKAVGKISEVTERNKLSFLDRKGIRSLAKRRSWLPEDEAPMPARTLRLAPVARASGVLPKLRLTERLHHEVPQGGPSAGSGGSF